MVRVNLALGKFRVDVPLGRVWTMCMNSFSMRPRSLTTLFTDLSDEISPTLGSSICNKSKHTLLIVFLVFGG